MRVSWLQVLDALVRLCKCVGGHCKRLLAPWSKNLAARVELLETQLHELRRDLIPLGDAIDELGRLQADASEQLAGHSERLDALESGVGRMPESDQ